MDFKKLENRYRSDASFNKMVNCFEQLICEHGFLPSELREGLFYAQWMIEMNSAREVIRTQDDWQKIYEARELLKAKFGAE